MTELLMETEKWKYACDLVDKRKEAAYLRKKAKCARFYKVINENVMAGTAFEF